MATVAGRVGTTAGRARAAQRPARGLPAAARARCCCCPTACRGRPAGFGTGEVHRPSRSAGARSSAAAAIDGARGRGEPVPGRPDRAADRPGAPPGRGGRDRLLDRPALRRLGDGARLVERARAGPRAAREPGAPDPDRQRRQPHLGRRRHPAGRGHAGDAAAERRGAAARGHRRRGRARLAEPRPVPHPAGRAAERAGQRARSPAAYDPANPNGVGFAVPAGTPVRAAAAARWR